MTLDVRKIRGDRNLNDRASWTFLFASVLFHSMSGCAAPASGETPEAAVRHWVDVVRSDEANARQALIHSATRQCINAQNRAYFDRIFTGQRRAMGDGTYSVTVAPFNGQGNRSGAVARHDYPVIPQYRAQIDFSDGSQTSSLDVFFATDQGELKEVLPCPYPEMSARMNDQARQAVEHDNDVAAQASTMPGDLRRRILSLLAEGKKVDAIQLYARETGSDIMIAKDVVESMRDQGVKPAF